MEPKSSLPCSQKPFTRLCSQAQKASPLSSAIFIFRHTLILSKYIFQYGRESVVGIVIRSVVRTPVLARFSTPVQPPVQGKPDLSRGESDRRVVLKNLPYLASKSSIGRPITLLPLCASNSMLWVTFTFMYFKLVSYMGGH